MMYTFSDAALATADVKAKAAAHARVARILAGKNLYLAELALGTIQVDGAQRTPPNPQGLIGVDHSGPPWGSCFIHPVVTMGGSKTDIDGDVANQKQVGKFSASLPFSLFMRPYVRPHASYERAPYSRLYPIFRAYRASGAVAANCEIIIHSSMRDVEGSSTSFTVSSTAPALIAPNVFLETRPGKCGVSWIEFKTTSTTEIIIECFSLNNIVKRKHP